MFFANLVFALVAALIFSALIAGLFGWRHPSGRADDAFGPFIFLFIILFLVAWVGGVWIQPFGPLAWGTAWLPFFLVAFFVALILLAAAAPSRRRVPASGETEVSDSAIIFGGFFWMLIVFLLAALGLSYVF